MKILGFYVSASDTAIHLEDVIPIGLLIEGDPTDKAYLRLFQCCVMSELYFSHPLGGP
jgi:hypothetical protein